MPTPQIRHHRTTRHYPRTMRQCPQCYTRFVGIYCQVYCQSACRNRAYYERKRQKRPTKKGAAAQYERLRKEIVASGVPQFNDGDIRAEIAKRKGQR